MQAHPPQTPFHPRKRQRASPACPDRQVLIELLLRAEQVPDRDGAGSLAWIADRLELAR